MQRDTTGCNGIRSSRFPLLPVTSARVIAVPLSKSMSVHLSENSCPMRQPVMYAIVTSPRHQSAAVVLGMSFGSVFVIGEIVPRLRSCDPSRGLLDDGLATLTGHESHTNTFGM